MQAGKNNDLSYVHKGNALKRKSNEKKSGIKYLKEASQTLQEKRKKISHYLIYFINNVSLPTTFDSKIVFFTELSFYDFTGKYVACVYCSTYSRVKF